jgi:tetratricopeptide (TPR) repeat protein
MKEEREAMRLTPDDAVAHYDLGNALGDKGDWDGAIKEYGEAIRLKPEFAIAHFNLGLALEHKWDRQSAVAEYCRTLELQPGNGKIRRGTH